MSDLRNSIESRDNLPNHIAVIMDGNGRWAQKQGVKRLFGHQNAIEAVRQVTEGCAELELKALTLYAFSTENWDRPKYEVEGLMTLLVHTIQQELATLQKNNVKLLAIGDISALPGKAQTKLGEAMNETKANTGMKLVLALNYSGRWDLVQAVNNILKKGEKEIQPKDVDMHLATAGLPDPDLLIRTSGEMRISNFLLWQLAYTELYFTEVLWPDFRKKHLHEAIKAYQKRERRFGKTGDQVNA